MRVLKTCQHLHLSWTEVNLNPLYCQLIQKHHYSRLLLFLLNFPMFQSTIFFSLLQF
uniref:Uncharacterized protein n=1 Tax=Arundo donax TaxID=35708 RepID=A0A0A9FMM8_ARUDO